MTNSMLFCFVWIALFAGTRCVLCVMRRAMQSAPAITRRRIFQAVPWSELESPTVRDYGH